MKDWLEARLVGSGPVEGAFQEALRDLFWMMPWWFPHLMLATAGLWVLFLWLAHRRRAARGGPASVRAPVERGTATVTRNPTREQKRLRLVA